MCVFISASFDFKSSNRQSPFQPCSFRLLSKGVLRKGLLFHKFGIRHVSTQLLPHFFFARPIVDLGQPSFSIDLSLTLPC